MKDICINGKRINYNVMTMVSCLLAANSPESSRTCFQKDLVYTLHITETAYYYSSVENASLLPVHFIPFYVILFHFTFLKLMKGMLLRVRLTTAVLQKSGHL